MNKLASAVILGVIIYFGYKYYPQALDLYNANFNFQQTSISPSPQQVQKEKAGINNIDMPLKVPSGYQMSIFASDLGSPRDLIFDPQGVVLVSVPNQGRIVSVENGRIEDVVTGLKRPHGLAFKGNTLFVAEIDGVDTFDYDPILKRATNKRKILDLPDGGEHVTRSLLIKDDKLYIAVGSSCNACIESDPRRAAIYWSNLDGSDYKPFATGLRNSVFLTLNPETNEIWATNMGRDYLGDDLPPDTINIVQQGKNYGWPFCYGNKVVDEQINPGGTKFDCSTMQPPRIEIQAHSAPLGLSFMGSDLLVAYHGSWNRSVPTGYKIVRFVNGKQQDFVSGWLQPAGKVLGRPVDILVKGSDIYISDDKAGVIYLLKPI